MQFTRKSFSNLAALESGEDSMAELQGGGPLAGFDDEGKESNASLSEAKGKRMVFVSNHLPIKMTRNEVEQCYTFELDEDALLVQAAKDAVPEDMTPIYVGCLSQEVPLEEQDEVSAVLQKQHNCYPVFLGEELKENFYKKFCKQQLWPMMHYLIPLDPLSKARFDGSLWSSYVRANMAFVNRLVEVLWSLENDFVWIHDYHLLVLPSLLRKRFHRIKCGFFLHSPFPSSEIFRTFPRREEVLRSLLNADVIGFHTFDYARHFLSCCSRMLGLEHKTSRGSIIMEYYGRDVAIKIMPTGVNPDRWLSACSWADTQWRIGELRAEYKDKMVLIGVDDMDVFKGIELKLAAFQEVLVHHPEWRGKLVLIQVTSAPRASGKDLEELHAYATNLVQSINARFGNEEENYQPVVWLERPVPIYERIALYSIADVAVVTATRDGMNLMPYEYIVCREAAAAPSMMVVSEFVGCSPSLSGAIRVNPWSIEAVRDGIYAAIRLSEAERGVRHQKHWKYVRDHTVGFWARSFIADLERMTGEHGKMQCYDLGFALDTFRMVSLKSGFKRLVGVTLEDKTSPLVVLEEDDAYVEVLGKLIEKGVDVVLVCREAKTAADFGGLSPETYAALGIIAESGAYLKLPNGGYEALTSVDLPMEFIEGILSNYTHQTDGSYARKLSKTIVWNYDTADPDFGAWQAKELVDHLEGVLGGLDVVNNKQDKEVLVKPKGVSKGRALGRVLENGYDFCLCVGNDRSDEDMFEALVSDDVADDVGDDVGDNASRVNYCVVVGQRPSKAAWYVNDVREVVGVLERMVVSDDDKEGSGGNNGGEIRGGNRVVTFDV